MTMLLVLTGCSSTSSIPDGEQLFTGLKTIKYVNVENNDHAKETQVEMESVLASAPNGSFFGSSYYHTPFPVRLWIWNAFAKDSTSVGNWLTRTFGSRPKLVSQVNPALHQSVAELQLKKFGYFNGKVNYQIVPESNPKKAKIAYTVDMGHLWRLDSIEYLHFPAAADSLIQQTKPQAKIHKGDPFSVPNLDAERQRLSRLLRNNGYYYAQSSDASYLADTLQIPGKALLRLQLADSLEPKVTKKWYIGKIDIHLRNGFMEDLKDSLTRRSFTMHYNGKKPPIRPGVIMSGLKLRPGNYYSLFNEESSSSYFHSTGLFNYYALQFTPRDSTMASDTLDLDINCVFDKKYNFYIEGNAKGKTSGRIGPEIVLGLTKLNAFRGGEKLDFNLHGSYEWQTGHKAEGSASKMNSYEYGGDVSITFPRILTPRNLFWSARQRIRQDSVQVRTQRRQQRARFYGYQTTIMRVSNNILNRAGYFRRHVVSGDLTYQYWTSPQSYHEFSPLTLSYEYMTSQTDSFKVLLSKSPYLQISMRNQFVPKMSYTYQYTSPAELRNPIAWKTKVSEAGNLLSLGYMVAGKKWNTKNKTMFKNPFAQFLKLETDFVKLWRLSENQSLVGHLNAGVVWSYGNASEAPYYEQFYVGGANSIRAFNVRSIGPGKYRSENPIMSYVDQTGDVKFLANLEYRPHLFGSLYGAVFLDAGNVWTLKSSVDRLDGQFQLKSLLTDLAVGTGVGIRYDMDLFVIRLDWGIGLHVPYTTSRSGFYNLPTFKDGSSINIAIGYPF